MVAFFIPHDTALLGIGAVLSILYFAEIVTMCFFWHAAWRTIQDPHARTTPAKAVGLMFIPVFNLYWAFVLIWGFAKDCNAFCRRYDLEQAAPRLPERFFLTVVIMWIVLVFLRYTQVAGVILKMALLRYMPAVGAVYGICFLLAVLVLLYKTARAVMAVQDHDA